MKYPLSADEKQQLWHQYQAQQPKKKLDFHLKRDLKHGWLFPYLTKIENLMWGRWQYWSECQMLPEVAWERWKLEKAMQRGLGGFPHERLHQEAIALIENRK
ncbi:MAG: hypothetical protein AAFR77_23800, partial [Cyanobacteria bacterium J06631_2]